MQTPASPAGSSSAALRAALLDYCQSPGRYQVSLRQPQAVFSALREVLQIAVGRDGDSDGSVGSEETAFLRDAARFFVRTAMLFPGADHYALLGVERTADNAELKDRYRLMMRLLHPDFSGPGAGNWPADSAVRVNRAYDTLSSAVQRRLYDESLAQTHAPSPVSAPEMRRARPSGNQPDVDTRQSRFKILAAVCALAGVGLLALILSATGSPESVHLVQRARVQPERDPEPAPVPVPMPLEEPAPPPIASPVARLQEALAQLSPAHVAVPAKPVETPVLRATPGIASPRRTEPPSALGSTARAAPPVARILEVAESRPDRVQPAREPLSAPPMAAPEPKPEILVAAAPAVAPTPPQVAPVVVSTPPVQAPPAPRPAPRPGPTLMEAQPLLSQLLQVMESGRGERILNLLDAETRSKPSAQALSRQYDSIVDGARPVRVSHVEFKAEPGDGRLLVVGYLRVLAGEQTIGALGKKMVLRAEFASREGNVVITGLSGGPVN